ncbi:MAG TPA: TlpA disulfide reductase family protein [Candidatus Acidoferrum sp.]|nr:TlpA disulfide reductase family protein [Candidatus Acidoferrum sp.]
MKSRILCLALGLCLLAGCNKTAAPAASTAATSPAADSAPAPASTEATSSQGAQAPSFQDLKGKPIKLADYAGKKVFINFWASWCAPCIREIPSIQRATEAMKNDNVVFLLASDETLDTINNFLLDRGFSGNFIKMNGYVGSLGIDVMPTSVLYDEKGTPIRDWKGPYEWDSAEMLAQIRNPAQ